MAEPPESSDTSKPSPKGTEHQEENTVSSAAARNHGASRSEACPSSPPSTAERSCVSPADDTSETSSCQAQEEGNTSNSAPNTDGNFERHENGNTDNNTQEKHHSVSGILHEADSVVNKMPIETPMAQLSGPLNQLRASGDTSQSNGKCIPVVLLTELADPDVVSVTSNPCSTQAVGVAEAQSNLGSQQSSNMVGEDASISSFHSLESEENSTRQIGDMSHEETAGASSGHRSQSSTIMPGNGQESTARLTSSCGNLQRSTSRGATAAPLSPDSTSSKNSKIGSRKEQNGRCCASQNLVSNTPAMDNSTQPVSNNNQGAGPPSRRAKKKQKKQQRQVKQVTAGSTSGLHTPHPLTVRSGGGLSDCHGGDRNSTAVKSVSDSVAASNRIKNRALCHGSRMAGGQRIANKQQLKKKSKPAPTAKQRPSPQTAPSTSGLWQNQPLGARHAERVAERRKGTGLPINTAPLTVPYQPTTDTENLSRRESGDPYVFCNSRLNNSHSPMMMMLGIGRLGRDGIWRPNHHPCRGAFQHLLPDEHAPPNLLLDERATQQLLPDEHAVRPDDSSPALKKTF